MFPLTDYEEANFTSISKNDSCFQDLVRFNTDGCPARDMAAFFLGLLLLICLNFIFVIIIFLCSGAADTLEYYNIFGERRYSNLREEEIND